MSWGRPTFLAPLVTLNQPLSLSNTFSTASLKPLSPFLYTLTLPSATAAASAKVFRASDFTQITVTSSPAAILDTSTFSILSHSALSAATSPVAPYSFHVYFTTSTSSSTLAVPALMEGLPESLFWPDVTITVAVSLPSAIALAISSPSMTVWSSKVTLLIRYLTEPPIFPSRPLISLTLPEVSEKSTS